MYKNTEKKGSLLQDMARKIRSYFRDEELPTGTEKTRSTSIARRKKVSGKSAKSMRNDQQMRRKIEAYVLGHMSNPEFSLEALAKGLGVGRTTLFNLIRRLFGKTPHAYILDARLERARTLYLQGKRRGEVASACGFADPKYFKRVYNKAFALTSQKGHEA